MKETGIEEKYGRSNMGSPKCETFDNILDKRARQLLKGLQKPLPIESIDFRVQSVSPKGFCTILAYKDARVDMNRLDEVVGAMNWKREHNGS